MLERDGEPVGGRAGQAGRLHQAGKGGRSGFERAEHQGGLVKNADSARVVHGLILASQHTRCKRNAETRFD